MKQIAVDFDTASQKATKGSNGGRMGANKRRAKKIWSDVRASARTGLGWSTPSLLKMAE